MVRVFMIAWVKNLIVWDNCLIKRYLSAYRALAFFSSLLQDHAYFKTIVDDVFLSF